MQVGNSLLLADTATILRTQVTMWPGFYQVELVVKDNQGQACPEPQRVKIQLCTCEDGLHCGRSGASGIGTKEIQLAPAGIGLLLLSLLMLLCESNKRPARHIFGDMSR